MNLKNTFLPHIPIYFFFQKLYCEYNITQLLALERDKGPNFFLDRSLQEEQQQERKKTI